jgi:hypothetical protein
MTQAVASNTRVTVEAAGAAYMDLFSNPFLQAFRGKDNYVDLPLIYDQKDILEKLVKPELMATIKHALETLNNFLFDNEHANFNPKAAEELKLRYGVMGELVKDLRYYHGSEMYVITTANGKYVIG